MRQGLHDYDGGYAVTMPELQDTDILRRGVAVTGGITSLVKIAHLVVAFQASL